MSDDGFVAIVLGGLVVLNLLLPVLFGLFMWWQERKWSNGHGS